MKCAMCDRDALSAWLCSMHYQRLRRLPEVMEEWPTLADGEPLPGDIDMLREAWLTYQAEKIKGQRGERLHYTAAERRLISEMRDAGVTLEAIGEAIGRSAPSVSKALAASGRKRKIRPYTRRMPDSVVVAAIEHRNRTGESWAMCAEAIGYSGTPEALRARAIAYSRRHGVDLRMGYPTVNRRGRG